MVFILSEQEEKVARYRDKISNIWAAIFIPIFIVIYSCIGALSFVFIRDGRSDDFRTLLIVINSVTLVFVFIFFICLALLWTEPEIRAMHHGFILFFSIFAISVPIAGFVYLEAPVGPEPYNAWYYNFRFGMFVFFQCMSRQCTLVGCLVLRQRVFYEIFCNYNLKPSLWTGVPFFLIICISIAVPFIACSYTQTCSGIVANSMHFAGMAIMAIFFAYFLVYTYSASKVFVQFWPNLRAFVLHNVVQILFLAAVLTNSIWAQVIDLTVTSFFVMVIILDSFSMSFLKAFARKFFRKQIFVKVDSCGAPYRVILKNEKLSLYLKEKLFYDSLLEYSKTVFADENVRFLKVIAENENLKKTSDIRKIADSINQIFVSKNAKYMINITCLARQETEAKLEDENWKSLEDIFTRAIIEIKHMVIMGILEPYEQTKEFKECEAIYLENKAKNENIAEHLYSMGVYVGPSVASRTDTNSEMCDVLKVDSVINNESNKKETGKKGNDCFNDDIKKGVYEVDVIDIETDTKN